MRSDHDGCATSRAWSGAELYQSGPWLVVFGSGTRSEDVARMVHKECRARDVDVETLAIDELGSTRLVYYLSLIAILPTAPITTVEVGLRPFERLIRDYRAQRPEGLRSARCGTTPWYAAGPVQVLGPMALMEHPVTRAMFTRAGVCVCHHIDEFAPLIDCFAPYATEPLHVVASRNGKAEGGTEQAVLENSRLNLEEWGILNQKDVPKLRKKIDCYRIYYRENRFSALGRPRNDCPDSSMLDLILDGPYDVIGDRATWLANAARVCREVRSGLREICDTFDQPKGRRNVQEDLRNLYHDLRIVEYVIEISGPGDRSQDS